MHQRLFVFLLLSIGAYCASVEEWQQRSLYQVMTDRFATAENSTDACDTAERRYCGGTWRGIMKHLDYIQHLGFDAIWISPVSSNIEGNTTSGEAFHGYWTRDLSTLNAHFGTSDDLKALSAALHDRDMLLMLDVVVNHVAALGIASLLLPNETSFVLPNVTTPTLDTSAVYNFSSYGPYFPTEQSYHQQCFISDYSNQTNVEQCWLGDKDLPLPDINTEDPAVVETLNKWIKGLVKEYDVDGLRLDTLKHVRKDFWPSFARAAGVFTLGEVISDNTTYTGAYTEVVDGILDYPTWFPLTAAFSSPSGNLSSLAEVVQKTQSEYKGGSFMTASFLENHDQPRFQSITTDKALVRNAMVWPFINDGIPVTYYGQEQGYTGASDPANREALWRSGYETSKPLVGQIMALNAARKIAIASKEDKFLKTPLKFIPQRSNATLIASKPPLLALLTNTGSAGYEATMAASAIPWKSLITLKSPTSGSRVTSKREEDAFVGAPSLVTESQKKSTATNTNATHSAATNATTVAPGALVTWELPSGTFSSGERLVDVLTCDRLVAGDDGSMNVTATFGMPKVLIPADKLSKNGKLCPASATNTDNQNQALSERTLSWAAMGVAAVLGLGRMIG